MGNPSSPLFQSIDETFFFEGVGKEAAEKFGTTVKLILIDKENVVVDVVYDEPLTLPTKEYTLPAVVVELIPVSTPEAREEGFRDEKDTTIHFQTAHLESIVGIVDVPEGSIIQVYDRQYDVISTQREGFMNNINKYMRVVCFLKRRTEFLPDRRKPDPI